MHHDINMHAPVLCRRKATQHKQLTVVGNKTTSCIQETGGALPETVSSGGVGRRDSGFSDGMCVVVDTRAGLDEYEFPV